MKLESPQCENNILLYLEFLAQSNLRSTKEGLCSRKVTLLVKSVKINAPLRHKVKGVFTHSMLRHLIKLAKKVKDGQVYLTLFLVAFFFSIGIIGHYISSCV